LNVIQLIQFNKHTNHTRIKFYWPHAMSKLITTSNENLDASKTYILYVFVNAPLIINEIHKRKLLNTQLTGKQLWRKVIQWYFTCGILRKAVRVQLTKYLSRKIILQFKLFHYNYISVQKGFNNIPH